MTPLALMFLMLSWSCVLGLTAWSFYRVLRADGRRRGGSTEPGEGPGGRRGNGTRPGSERSPE